MKVIIASEDFPSAWGGAGVTTNLQCEMLAKRGVNTTVVTTGDQFREDYIGKLRIVRVPTPTTNETILNRYASKLLEKAEKRYDIFDDDSLLHIANSWYACSDFARSKHVPTLITIHYHWPMCYYNSAFMWHGICLRCSPLQLLRCIFSRNLNSARSGSISLRLLGFLPEFVYAKRKIEKIQRSLLKMDAIITLSKPSEAFLLRFIPRLTDTNVHTIYLSSLAPELPYVKPCPKDDFTFAFLSYPIEDKGIFNLLKAFHIVTKKKDRIKLKIAGGAQIIEVRKTVRELRLNNQVELLNWQPADKLAKYLPDVLKDVDIVAIPSLVFECWPRVTIESWLCGRTLLASHIGGLTEQVRDGVNGFFANCYNVDKLAGKILDIASLPRSEIVKMGHEAREHFLKTYSEEKIFRSLIKVYQQVLKKDRYRGGRNECPSRNEECNSGERWLSDHYRI